MLQFRRARGQQQPYRRRATDVGAELQESPARGDGQPFKDPRVPGTTMSRSGRHWPFALRAPFGV